MNKLSIDQAKDRCIKAGKERYQKTTPEELDHYNPESSFEMFHRWGYENELRRLLLSGEISAEVGIVIFMDHIL